MKNLVLFAHGKESGPWGSKIKYLASIAERHNCKVLSPDYSDLMDPDARVKRLLATALLPHDRLVMVGSSMGGYISTVASQKLQPKGLFLMAPAFNLPGYQEQSPRSGAEHNCVVLGWNDEIIPVANGIAFAQAHCAELHILDSDHRLDGVLQKVGSLFEGFLETILNVRD